MRRVVVAVHLLSLLFLSACSRLVAMSAADGRPADGPVQPRDAGFEGLVSLPDGPSRADSDRTTDLSALPDLAPPDLAQDLIALPDLCDTEPGPLTLSDVAHQPPDTAIVDPFTVSGIDCPVLAEVSGNGNPMLQVNGSGNWVKAATVLDGDKLEVRAITSPTLGVTQTVTVVVGARSRKWRLTTCTAPTCMMGSLGANLGCTGVLQRVWRWQCPGSSDWIYASEFTHQFSGTGLLTCPPKAVCEWQTCSGIGWEVGTLSCP